MAKEEIIINLSNKDKKRETLRKKQTPLVPKKRASDLGRRRVSSISSINFYDLSEIKVGPNSYSSLYGSYFSTSGDILSSWELNIKPRLEDCLIYTPSQMRERYRRINQNLGEKYRLYLNPNNELLDLGFLKRTTRLQNSSWKNSGLSIESEVYPISYLQVLCTVNLGSEFTYRSYELTTPFNLFPLNECGFGEWDFLGMKATTIPDISAPHTTPPQLTNNSRLEVFINPAIHVLSYTEPGPSIEEKLGIMPREELFSDNSEFQEGQNSEARDRISEILEADGLPGFIPNLSYELAITGELISVLLIDDSPFYIWRSSP